MQCAIRNECVDIVKILMKKASADIDDALEVALEIGNTEIIELLQDYEN